MMILTVIWRDLITINNIFQRNPSNIDTSVTWNLRARDTVTLSRDLRKLSAAHVSSRILHYLIQNQNILSFEFTFECSRSDMDFKLYKLIVILISIQKTTKVSLNLYLRNKTVFSWGGHHPLKTITKIISFSLCNSNMTQTLLMKRHYT